MSLRVEERDARLRETLPACDRIRLVASQPATLEAHEAIIGLGFEGTVLKASTVSECAAEGLGSLRPP